MVTQTKRSMKQQSLFTAWWCSLYIAFFLLLMALGQLFAFEDMPGIVASWDMPLVSDAPHMTAAVLVTLTVFAIPALVGMKLPPLVRSLSSAAGWVVLTAWLSIALWLYATSTVQLNAGVFGAKVHLPPGLWLCGFVLLLLAMRIFLATLSRRT